jgi:hypothetical protein
MLAMKSRLVVLVVVAAAIAVTLGNYGWIKLPPIH